jgi:hypothetical protein
MYLLQILLLFGCVDASAATCHYNLKRKRSVLIFVGGEKEQLMTEPGNHKVYLLNRKGFVKLALQYGCDLVPMVCYASLKCCIIAYAVLVCNTVCVRRERGIRHVALPGR